MYRLYRLYNVKAIFFAGEFSRMRDGRAEVGVRLNRTKQGVVIHNCYELANRLGVTPQALSKWEKSASSPDLLMLSLICKILDVSAD